MDNLTQIVEAILFASGTERSRTELLNAFNGQINKSELDKSINELLKKYDGKSGITLLSFNNKLQLSSNHLYGEIVAEILTPLKEKELSKVLLEVLAIIAYKQPITKSEIEEIKITSAEYALSVLLKVGLVTVSGHKDAVGRPALYVTTDDFLKKFQLENIHELPDYQSVMARLEELGDFYKPQVELYREIDIDLDNVEKLIGADGDERSQAIIESFDNDAIVDDFMENDEIPDFLEGEDYNVVD